MKKIQILSTLIAFFCVSTAHAQQANAVISYENGKVVQIKYNGKVYPIEGEIEVSQVKLGEATIWYYKDQIVKVNFKGKTFGWPIDSQVQLAASINVSFIDSTSIDSTTVFVDYTNGIGISWLRWGEDVNLASQESSQAASGSGQLTFVLFPSKQGTKHYTKAFYWDTTLTSVLTTGVYTFTTPGSAFNTVVTLLPGNSGSGGTLVLDFTLTTNDSSLQVWAAYEEGTVLTSLAKSSAKTKPGIVSNQSMQISIPGLNGATHAAAILSMGSDLILGSSDTNTYNVLTSVFDLEGKKVLVAVYPNPVGNEGTISISGDVIKGGKFSLFNIIGKKIDAVYIGEETEKFEYKTSGLPSGIYPYQIETQKGDKATGKLVIY